MSERLVWAVALGILGAIIGSFVAALVTRWRDDRSVMQGRSACDSCGTTLGPVELVPLVSALVQRGRCRTCRAPIAPLHWRIELAALAIGAVSGGVVAGPAALAGAAFGWLLLALGSLDLIAFWLPDRLTATLALGGAVSAIWFDPGPLDRAIGGAAGFGVLWTIAAVYRRVRGRDGMGGGDPKLFGAIGLWLGWQLLPAVLLIASMVGLGAVLATRLRGRAVAADTALPFGTLLAIAAYPAWLFMIAGAP
ncbi:prepilin peptidase [Sphingomonas ginsenosidivorax]|uniref:Prepilin leader peptidase/N-methyltransferase n=1 Tax=Sphingomonas ginsenosidivorax TaxID=862135 RepID=A0A5C6UCI7_9SPHN|nr:A24 family peptidase [Sphingomonas ginsenosidivorax]TXC70433.1 prepilin peptidase [Sphingomonas ginsenosidivorax]